MLSGRFREHPPSAVLVHCFAGLHRTGAYCAAYRMGFNGWSQQQAILEMKHLGYDCIFNETDVCGYLQHFHINHSARTLKAETPPASTLTSTSNDQ